MGVGVLRSITATSSLWLVFFVNGAVLSSWAPRIPAVAADLELTDGALGVALFGVAAGSVPTLLLTARVLRRVSAARMCRLSGFAFAAALPLIALATDLAQLTAALVVLGAASGALDVAMNTAGVHQERQMAPRRILSRLHGGYSVGVLAGSAGGALAAALNAPVLVHFGVVAVALLALMAISGPRLPDSSVPAGIAQIGGDGASARVRFPSVLLLALAVGALLLEGTVTDWSALLVARDLGAGATVGASAVVVFNLTMALSRTFGDRLATAIGVRALTVGGSLLAGLALALGAAQPDPAVFLLAVALAGAGLGPLFPAVISAAGQASTGDVGTATATVTAVGYLAYLAGPPLVGLSAEQFGLATTITAAAGIAGLVMVLAAGRTFTRVGQPSR